MPIIMTNREIQLSLSNIKFALYNYRKNLFPLKIIFRKIKIYELKLFKNKQTKEARKLSLNGKKLSNSLRKII